MARETKNYAWTTGRDLPEVKDGAVLDGYNLAQRDPHTRIFAGKKGLTFRRCLLVNCDLPDGSVTEECNPSHVSLCSHLHEKWVAKGLSECSENCDHVTRVDEIEVDGMLIDTVYHYQDKGVS